MPEGLRILEAAAHVSGIDLAIERFDFASADRYLADGQMLPDDCFDQLSDFDAILFAWSDGTTSYPTMCPCGAVSCSSAGRSTSTSTCDPVG